MPDTDFGSGFGGQDITYEPQPPPPPPRRHWIRWTAAGVGALLVVLVAVGVASEHGSHRAVHAAATTAPAAVPSPAMVTDPGGYACEPSLTDANGYCPADAPTPTPSPTGPDYLNVGDGENIGDASTGAPEGTVTVESVYVTTHPADQYGSAPAHGYFVVVHVKATADSSYTDGFDINALDFYALTGGTHNGEGDGNAYSALSDSQSSTDITATLAAGETSTGWIAFDVASPHGHIVYAPNSDGQPLAEWTF